MKVLVQNLTNETKQICRFGGAKLFILPYNFVTFDCYTNAESSFWGKQSIVDNSKNGIKVIVDISEISKLIKLRNAGKLPTGQVNTTVEVNKPVNNVENDVKETPIVAEPIVEVKEEEVQTFNTVQEAEPITEELVEVSTEDIISTDVDNVRTDVEEVPVDVVDEVENNVESPIDTDNLTRDYLETLSKAELQVICENKGISYKKNNSVNTLISLILGE